MEEAAIERGDVLLVLGSFEYDRPIMVEHSEIEAAARALRAAEHLLITAGAGMGVDSGLPDFRGDEGFWNAYPPYRKLGMSFVDLANPRSFLCDPELAWGFYGHRLHLYRTAVPHEGFQILRRIARAKNSHFVLTSNVDGHFQGAGFDPDRVYEIHGSIHFLQCSGPCSDEIIPADGMTLAIEETTMRATPPLPTCAKCQRVLRPNILLFGDGSWLSDREEVQRTRYRDWVESIGDDRLAIVEMGAGTAIPSVRWAGEDLAAGRAASLIRINPREPSVPAGQISLPMGALEALRMIAVR